MRSSCLVSVASQGRENYNKAQLALIDSSLGNWQGDYLMRSVDGYCANYYGVNIELDSWPVTEKHGTSWQHADMPYQFKPFAIQEAREKGYTQILWCDSTIRVMLPVEPLWAQVKEHGILAWNNEGHSLEDWISDFALDKLGVPDVIGWKQIMACCIMFDFSNKKCVKVFDKWLQGSINGSFYHDTSRNLNYKGSRHDQAYLSALMQLHNIPIQDYGALAYPHHTPIKPTFLNWGV